MLQGRKRFLLICRHREVNEGNAAELVIGKLEVVSGRDITFFLCFCGKGDGYSCLNQLSRSEMRSISVYGFLFLLSGIVYGMMKVLTQRCLGVNVYQHKFMKYVNSKKIYHFHYCKLSHIDFFYSFILVMIIELILKNHY